uniref:Uncharacterized protein n=1 Tax=Arundo donax TaxID=35708 RepID=A0A0A8YMZ9_ARUDO
MLFSEAFKRWHSISSSSLTLQVSEFSADCSPEWFPASPESKCVPFASGCARSAGPSILESVSWPSKL